MVCEMVEKWGRAGFYLSCNCSALVKILLVKLKNLRTSACLNLNYGTAKDTKNMKVAKMVVFQLHNLLPAGGGGINFQKTLSGENG